MTHTTSKRTWIVAAIGLLLVLGAAIGIAMPQTGEFADMAISDIVETVIGLGAAAFIIWAAVSIGAGEPVGRQWLFIGGGVLMFAIGDVVWTVYEVFMQVDPPYPGLSDVFYLLQYPLLCAGVVMAALAYRSLLDIKVPVMVSALITAALAVPAWIFVIQPIVGDEEVSALEKVVSAFYPLGDLVLLFAPVMFIVLVVMKLSGGLLGRPWWAVGVGLLCLAFADTVYVYLESVEKYVSGMAIDYGWMAGLVLIAVGASLMHDIQKPAR